MDIVSHGLWGGVGFGRASKPSFWLAFTFGVAPDLLSFGIFFIERIFTGEVDINNSHRPDLSSIPGYVSTLYNFTHSFVLFAVIFLLVWLFLKRPVIEMCAWGFHILLDIFTHSSDFFPTPFLWPLSNFKVNGVSWGHPIIFIPNLVLLALAYIWFFYSKRNRPKDR